MAAAQPTQYELVAAWNKDKDEECVSNKLQRCDDCWAALGTFITSLVITIVVFFGYLLYRQSKHRKLLLDGIRAQYPGTDTTSMILAIEQYAKQRS